MANVESRRKVISLRQYALDKERMQLARDRGYDGLLRELAARRRFPVISERKAE